MTLSILKRSEGTPEQQKREQISFIAGQILRQRREEQAARIQAVNANR